MKGKWTNTKKTPPYKKLQRRLRRANKLLAQAAEFGLEHKPTCIYRWRMFLLGVYGDKVFHPCDCGRNKVQRKLERYE